MINDLESEWKVTLLERSRAGVRLTSDGLRLLPYAKSVCEEYRKLQAQVDSELLTDRDNTDRHFFERRYAPSARNNQPFPP